MSTMRTDENEITTASSDREKHAPHAGVDKIPDYPLQITIWQPRKRSPSSRVRTGNRISSRRLSSSHPTSTSSGRGKHPRKTQPDRREAPAREYACGRRGRSDRIPQCHFRGRTSSWERAAGSAFYRRKSTNDVFRSFHYDRLERTYKNVRLESFDKCSDYISVPIRPPSE